jgi:hypothetical protein
LSVCHDFAPNIFARRFGLLFRGSFYRISVDVGYFDELSIWFLTGPLRNAWIRPVLSHEHFLSNPVQFTVRGPRSGPRWDILEDPRKHLAECAKLKIWGFTAVTVKNGVFWVVTPCGSCKNQRFGGTYCLHHQDDKNWWTRSNVSHN